jgi:hypothetical protein
MHSRLSDAAHLALYSLSQRPPFMRVFKNTARPATTLCNQAHATTSGGPTVDGHDYVDLTGHCRMATAPTWRMRRVIVMKTKSSTNECSETFVYPLRWEAEYRKTHTVKEWKRVGRSTKPGLGCFAQYALRHLLRRGYGIKSKTWLYIASIDDDARRRLAAHKPWAPASPRPNNHGSKRTLRNWTTMRKVMTAKTFDTLQEAIVLGGFTGFTGEPDLFCYSPDGNWFFAEVKSISDKIGAHQQRWFGIANKALGTEHQVRVYGVVPDPTL